MFCMWVYYNIYILLVLKEAMSLTFERSINLLENVTSINMSQLLDTGVRYSEVSAIQGFSYKVLD